MDTLFRCEECDKIYGSESGLNKHIRDIHTENEIIEEVKDNNQISIRDRYRIICTECEELFKSLRDFIDHTKQYHYGENIKRCFYPNDWEKYKQKFIKTQDKEETKKSKPTDCECKKDIKELKEVVKVLQKLVMDVLKVKYSQTKSKKKESNNKEILDLEENEPMENLD
jgi:uncharacterized C2H2 Zn-finger protein